MIPDSPRESHPAPDVRVANVQDIPMGEARIFTHGRYDLALFHLDDGFFALENMCPHQGGPVGEGTIDDGVVTCPWHGWCFDIRTGRMTLGDFARVRRFALRCEGDAIFASSEPQEDEP